MNPTAVLVKHSTPCRAPQTELAVLDLADPSWPPVVERVRRELPAPQAEAMSVLDYVELTHRRAKAQRRLARERISETTLR